MKEVVLVTGSSRGIGRATAELFASNGFNVIINYINQEEVAKQLAEDFKQKYNIEAISIKADVSNESDVKKMVDLAIKTFGKIDVLVNNAGIAIDKDFNDRTLEDFKKTFEVNVFGTFLVSKYVSENMLKNKKGKIINISSTNGIDTIYPTSIDYDASKAAIISLTKNMALQFAPYINVNSIAPGWINTDMNLTISKEDLDLEYDKILLKRFAEPEEIAKVVYFLASDKSSYINGEVIRVDGGM